MKLLLCLVGVTLLAGCGDGDCGVVRIDRPEEMLGTWRFTVTAGGASSYSTFELTNIDHEFGDDASTAILGASDGGGGVELTWIAVTQQWRLVDFVMSYRTDVFIFAVCDTKALGDYYQFLATPSGLVQLGPIPFVGDRMSGL